MDLRDISDGELLRHHDLWIVGSALMGESDGLTFWTPGGMEKLRMRRPERG